LIQLDVRGWCNAGSVQLDMRQYTIGQVRKYFSKKVTASTNYLWCLYTCRHAIPHCLCTH